MNKIFKLLTHWLPWLLVPLMFMLMTGREFYMIIVLGTYTVLVIDYFAMQRKRWIPVAFLGATLSAFIGYYLIFGSDVIF